MSPATYISHFRMGERLLKNRMFKDFTHFVSLVFIPPYFKYNNQNTGWSKSLCAPDDYSPKKQAKIF
jgi:hypothetical protein